MFKLHLPRILLISVIAFSASSLLADEKGPETGTVIGKHIFGLARDFQHDPVMLNESPLIYPRADHSFNLSIDETAFEIALFNGDIASAYLTELAGENSQPIDTKAIDIGPVGGAHSIGSAIKSAWDTVLFTESSLVNAQEWSTFKTQFMAYFKNKVDMLKPYQYGWLNEIILLDSKGSAKVIKNFVAGRTFATSIIAMPDAKTFYFHDSNHSGNLYLFIADEPNSFAKGTLYAISADQNAEPLELGSASALKMKFKLRKSSFEDFFKSSDVRDGACQSNFTYIKTVYGEECLNIQKKNRKYVGQFEPIRSAAIQGVKPFSSIGSKIVYERNNSVIKVIHNGDQSRRYLLVPSKTLGTQYLITQEG